MGRRHVIGSASTDSPNKPASYVMSVSEAQALDRSDPDPGIRSGAIQLEEPVASESTTAID